MIEFFTRLRCGATSRLATALFFLPVLWLSGCAATSTFTGHPAKIDPLIASLDSGKPVDVGATLVTECRGSDGILYEMERGRLAQILGKGDLSMHEFSAAAARIRESDEKASISLSDLGANVAALGVNDNALPYQAAGYERVMLHHYQALNYLERTDLEGAGVELRIANAEQEEALRRHEEEVERALEQARKEKVEQLANDPDIATRYAQMDESAGQVKNSFQNAYTFYLSGFINEAMQQPNDAYIDYKKALEIHPENSFVQKDVRRLAKKLGMDEESKAQQPAAGAETTLSNSGDLLVLFEDGFVPSKTQVKIPLPIPDLSLVAVAFPVYQARWTSPRPLTVATDGGYIGTTEPICDLRALAVKALQEEVPVIATRQVVRLVSKGAAAKLAREKLGLLGEVGVSLWNVVSENADLRSWLSLPGTVQVLRIALPPGTRRLTITPAEDGIPVVVEVKVTGGSRNILRVVRTGQRLYTSLIPVGVEKGAVASLPPVREGRDMDEPKALDGGKDEET